MWPSSRRFSAGCERTLTGARRAQAKPSEVGEFNRRDQVSPPLRGEPDNHVQVTAKPLMAALHCGTLTWRHTFTCVRAYQPGSDAR